MTDAGAPADGDDGAADDERAAGTAGPDGPASARSPATDPRAPEPANPRRRLVVVGVVVLMLAASVGGIAWAVTQTGSTDATVPTAAFDHSYEGDERTALTYTGGDSVLAGNIVVEVDGDRATWADLRFGVDDDDTISAGDSVVLVGVEPGDELTVRYVAGDLDAAVANGTVGDGG
ncbi:hypothetical protein [Haloarchaeobius iranensis]|uniref:Uncharacterized protein n=1 Tax=Haloarchaeobius iranensis TaxID=996166 RepID=A0A1G9XQ53_9EURY|nr:hypothetical protein [Haloarchaeobius iranensis]SDM98907.1 hypothetical protein SAMN05192554_11182 [Haloarchaeobius iranensis]